MLKSLCISNIVASLHRMFSSWCYDFCGFEFGFNTNGVLFKKGVSNKKGVSYD